MFVLPFMVNKDIYVTFAAVCLRL